MGDGNRFRASRKERTVPHDYRFGGPTSAHARRAKLNLSEKPEEFPCINCGQPLAPVLLRLAVAKCHDFLDVDRWDARAYTGAPG